MGPDLDLNLGIHTLVPFNLFKTLPKDHLSHLCNAQVQVQVRGPFTFACTCVPVGTGSGSGTGTQVPVGPVPSRYPYLWVNIYVCDKY